MAKTHQIMLNPLFLVGGSSTLPFLLVAPPPSFPSGWPLLLLLSSFSCWCAFVCACSCVCVCSSLSVYFLPDHVYFCPFVFVCFCAFIHLRVLLQMCLLFKFFVFEEIFKEFHACEQVSVSASFKSGQAICSTLYISCRLDRLDSYQGLSTVRVSQVPEVKTRRRSQSIINMAAPCLFNVMASGAQTRRRGSACPSTRSQRDDRCLTKRFT